VAKALSSVHPWERAWSTGSWKERSAPLPAVLEFIDDLKRAGVTRVLDLGAGAGRHTLVLARAGFQVVALDVSETALTTLDRRVREKELRNVIALKHEMNALPFTDGYFDAVLSTNVLHHGLAKEIRLALGEVHRVMKDGGMGLLVMISDKDYRAGSGKLVERGTWVFTEGNEKGITHHFFSRRELRSFLAAFDVESLQEVSSQTENGIGVHFHARVRKTSARSGRRSRVQR
jgi:ubiquinone/menaquinone biosynthesis C-methylase UbiE